MQTGLLKNLGIALLAASFVAGCSSLSDGFGLFGGEPAEKPAQLVEFKPTASARTVWQGSAGGAREAVFYPALLRGDVYAAGQDGQVARYDADNGKLIWRIETGQKLSGGVGVGNNLVVVGTGKGEVLAYDANGQPLWQARVSSEVVGAPQVADATVVVRTGDSRIFALDAADGKRKWVYQRAAPALTLRGATGVVVTRGAVFAGFPGGKLVALDLGNGNVGWEANVALPRGATELERIADVIGLPVVDGNVVYAVAFQGRVVCFDIASGNPVWAREMSSTAGLAVDQRNVYISDARGAVHALDKASGASVWKQDKLFARQLSAPRVLNGYVAVGDFQGYVHFLSRDDGSFAARIATDGGAIRAQPLSLGEEVLVQTQNGGLFALSIR